MLATPGPELWQWLQSVEPPPGPLAVPRRQRPASASALRGLHAGERIARAVAAVMAEKGYGAMSTDDIAAQASISLSTFYDHFADKRDAVLGALEMSGAQIMALAVPAARRAGDWQQGVRALYEAICAYFVAEPAMAELATVGVYGARCAGARPPRPGDRLADGDASAGVRGEPRGAAGQRRGDRGDAVYALMREQRAKRGPESLAEIVPLATYITLVTFVGPDRACAVANGEGRGR